MKQTTRDVGGGAIIERNSFLFESIPHFGLLVEGFGSPLTFLQTFWTFESGRAEADFDLLLLEVA